MKWCALRRHNSASSSKRARARSVMRDHPHTEHVQPHGDGNAPVHGAEQSQRDADKDETRELLDRDRHPITRAASDLTCFGWSALIASSSVRYFFALAARTTNSP